jgi:hypothetical protein
VHATRDIAAAVCTGDLSPTDVTSDLLSACMYTAGAPPLDLLVRTSGEVRLSDFMLWQAACAQLSFVPALWPEFGLRHLAAVLLRYQHARPALLDLRAREARRTARAQTRTDLADLRRGERCRCGPAAAVGARLREAGVPVDGALADAAVCTACAAGVRPDDLVMAPEAFAEERMRLQKMQDERQTRTAVFLERRAATQRQWVDDMASSVRTCSPE